ncbi:MAG TPA: hypothetical protein VGF67_26060 [Ktedonobacteraceae bacterium]
MTNGNYRCYLDYRKTGVATFIPKIPSSTFSQIDIQSVGGKKCQGHAGGTFSVIDHRSVETIVPEILLYDRLIIPTPYDPASRFDDRARWEANGWDPEGLLKRLDQLKGLVVTKKWDPDIFRTNLDEVRKTQQEIDNYGMTRFILAQGPQEPEPGMLPPIVVAAYPSEAEFKRDFTIEHGTREFEPAYLAALLIQRLAFPIVRPNDEDTLKKAIDLVKSPGFSQKRQNLHDWQEQVINQGYPARHALHDLELLIDDYNSEVKRALNDVYIKYVYMIATLAFSIAGGAIGNPLLAAGALVPLIQLLTGDGKPVIPSEKSSPVAMFHDVKKILGRNK